MSTLFTLPTGDPSTSDDWYTPRWIFDALAIEFDIDVCGPEAGASVPAMRTFTIDHNGLDQTWHGVGAELTERRGERSRKEALFDLVEDGLTEAARITRLGGWVLAKAGRGIDGGKLVRTDDLMVRTGEDMGLNVLTTLLLLSRPRSQAHRGPQKTPRANFSTLIVFEVP